MKKQREDTCSNGLCFEYFKRLKYSSNCLTIFNQTQFFLNNYSFNRISIYFRFFYMFVSFFPTFKIEGLLSKRVIDVQKLIELAYKK